MRLNRASVLYNASVLSVSGLILQVLNFVYAVYLSRMAGAEGLGVFRLVFPVFTVVSAGALSGIRLAVTTLSARLLSLGNAAGIRQLVRRSLALFLFVFLIMAVPAAVFYKKIASGILLEPRTAPAILLMLLYVFFTGFEGIFESLFIGMGKTRITAVSNLMEQAFRTVFVLLFLQHFGKTGDISLTAALIVLGMVFAELPILIWLFGSYRREVPTLSEPYSPRLTRITARILSIAAPASLCALVTGILASVGTVILPGRLIASGLGEHEAISALGVLSGMAMPLVMFPMVLIRSMSSVLLPVITQSSSAGTRKNVDRKVRKAFQVTGLIVLPFTAILVPFALPLSKILFNQELPLVYFVLLSAAAIATYYEMISVGILQGLGMHRRVTFNIITGEAVGLLITYFLASLPRLHIYGYITGMILGPLVVVVLSLPPISRKVSNMPDPFDCFVIPGIASAAAGLFARFVYLRYYAETGSEIVSVTAGILLFAVICIGVLLILGLRPLRYYRTLLSENSGKRR